MKPERHFAVLPSNQPFYKVVIAWLLGKRTVSEQIIQVKVAGAVVEEFLRQGYDAALFFTPGDSGGSGDRDSIPELKQMIARSYAWLGHFASATRRCISTHSNSGTATNKPIYPQICLEADRSMGRAQAAILARRVGGVTREPKVRSLLFMKTMRKLGSGRAILHEIGQHQTVAGAQNLYTYAEFDGIQIARTWLEWEKLPFVDGPVPAGVAVPTGAQFDKYRPIAEPDCSACPLLQYPAKTPVLTVGGKPSPDVEVALITIAGKRVPILRDKRGGAQYIDAYQRLLVKKGYRVAIDGYFGEESAEGTEKLQKASNLPVSGHVGLRTWQAAKGS